MATNNLLPSNWVITKLGEVCITTSGGTPSRKVPKYFGGNIPWVKSGELDKGLILDTDERISEEAIQDSSAKIFPKGTLLIALYGATVGKLAFLGIDAASNQAVCGIYKSGFIESNFLYHFLFFRKNKLVSQSIGGAQPNISQAILKDLDFPLPPLPEQHRIVSKIEQLFTDLDKGIEYLKTAQQQLKVYRQAVLKWAFEGRLTNENVVDGELPKGWFWKAIEDVADISTGVTPLRTDKSFWENGTIPWITSGALNDTFVYKAEEFVTQKAFDETTLKLLPKHTLLLALYGEGKTRGKCSELMFESTTNQAIAGIKLKKEFEQSRNFLKWFLLKNYQDIRLLSAGGVQPNLNSTIVKKTPFPFPSRNEQTKIVKEIESRLSVCDKIEEIIETSLLQAEALRLSILKKAFEGKLVKQNPTDEPAQKLLEKIRAEMKKNAPGIQEKEVKIKPLKRKLNKHERK